MMINKTSRARMINPIIRGMEEAHESPEEVSSFFGAGGVPLS
jgi:hypothetical protein